MDGRVKALNINIGVSRAASNPLDLLQLEQEDWKPYVGYITTSNMVRVIAEYLYNEDFGSSIECGIDGGSLITVVYAYPKVADLDYVLNISRGTISKRIVQEYTEETVLRFSLNDSASLKYPCGSVISTEWIGDTFAVRGEEVNNVTVNVTGQDVQLSQKVRGRLKIKYKVLRHKYGVSIKPRKKSIENHFSSTVFGIYAGGLNYLVLSEPPNIDSFDTASEENCNGGFGVTGSLSSEDDNLPDDMHRNANRVKVVEYCGQRTITDNIYAY